MKIYRLFGDLGKELKFEVYEWTVLKETEKTFEIISDDIFPTKKRLNKEKIDVIRTNTVNTVDSLISYNVYISDPSKIDYFKNEIQKKLVGIVKYYEDKTKEKIEVLKANGIDI